MTAKRSVKAAPRRGSVSRAKVRAAVREVAVAKDQKQVRFKLSPELADGDHWTVVQTKSELLEHIDAWAGFTLNYDCVGGRKFSVETVEMTDQEVEALPDI